MYQLFIPLIVIFLQNTCDSFDNFDLFSLLSQRDPNTVYHSPIPEKLVNEYLQNFGYFNQTLINDTNIPELISNNILTQSIKEFQKFSGLPETGVLDDDTKLKMGTPRCGISDIEVDNINDIKKRSITKWSKSTISYTINKYSNKLNIADSKDGLTEAFSLWSSVVPLKFYETENNGDVEIKFATGRHGDSWPFDGSGGTLAHASLGTDGFLHFDDAENWKYVRDSEKLNNNQIDYLSIATHEIGHVLGLRHSEDPNSIMTPFYKSNIDINGNYIKPKLSYTDIQNIQSIYGGSLNKENTLYYLFNGVSSNYYNNYNNPQISNTPNNNEDRFKYGGYIPLYFYYFPFFH